MYITLPNRPCPLWAVEFEENHHCGCILPLCPSPPHLHHPARFPPWNICSYEDMTDLSLLLLCAKRMRVCVCACVQQHSTAIWVYQMKWVRYLGVHIWRSMGRGVGPQWPGCCCCCRAHSTLVHAQQWSRHRSFWGEWGGGRVRAFRFSKIFSDFCWRVLNTIYCLNWHKRILISKQKAVGTQRRSIYIVKMEKLV